MTIGESIVQWLQQCEVEGSHIGSIDTDSLKAAGVSYALMKAPQENVKRYLSGKELHTDHYQFLARLNSGTNTDRIDNHAWFEGLTEWVSRKARERDFPELRDGLRCTGISITSPFYAGQGDHNTAIYQLTIAIKYEQ